MGHGMIWRRLPSNGAGRHVPSGFPVQVGCTLSTSMPVRIDGFKLRKSVSTFGPPSLVRRQVARNNVWEYRRPNRRWRNQNEVSTAAQIHGRIDLLGVSKVTVSTHC